MSITKDQAIIELSTNKTVSELFELVAKVSGNLNESGAGQLQAGDTFALFSGKMPDGTLTSTVVSEFSSNRLPGQRVWDIGDTHVGQFVDSKQFRYALEDALAQEKYLKNFSELDVSLFFRTL